MSDHNEIQHIKSLEKEYNQLKNNTPFFSRDGEECRAFHAWYNAASVYFSQKSELKTMVEYQKFTNIEASGNCFVLEDKYDVIQSSYKILMKAAENCNDGGIIKRCCEKTSSSVNSIWPFTSEDGHKRVFISYSWDSQQHQDWVKKLCDDLRSKGVEAIMDIYMPIGIDLIDFMDKGIEMADKVLIVGTENYKKKSESDKGGVKYEQNIIKSSIFANWSQEKYITLLRQGNDFLQAFPAIISTRNGFDMRSDNTYKKNLDNLVRNIYDAPSVTFKSLGEIPVFENSIDKK